MTNLEELRAEIDRVDSQLIKVLKDRFLIIRKIGHLKNIKNIPLLDQSRWQKVLDNRLEMADKFGISKDFIKKVWNLIHDEALKIEENEK